MNNYIKEALIKRWTEENTPYGKMLGYPECCITAFCQQPPEVLKESKLTDDDKKRYEAGCIDGKFTGFIPCADHAKRILSGEITLASLIKDRDSGFPPFPETPSFEHFVQ